ncbi:hypothetical protein DPMN_058739 [Dreissena polymorpha]|uniref:WAP domain-containing protein n=1 Tax=Dreissena polymorpha TaxID=45954 RepID=A0A9D4C2R8_DREPO|nr:hypothetical protein DPMN_058739 [Dreissena polymorpha]
MFTGGKRQCTADDDVTMICPVQCQGDDTCPGSQKCCQYGCMITCLDPVSYDGPTTRLPGPCIVRLAEWEAANRRLGFERPLYAANEPSVLLLTALRFLVSRSTECAGDQYAFKQTINVGQRFYCDRFGNYKPIGCRGAMCYCQDRRGNQIGDSVNIVDADSLYC